MEIVSGQSEVNSNFSEEVIILVRRSKSAVSEGQRKGAENEVPHLGHLAIFITLEKDCFFANIKNFRSSPVS